MILAIFFDLDGTLIDRAEAHRRYCLDLMAQRPDAFPPGRSQADLEALHRRGRRARVGSPRIRSPGRRVVPEPGPGRGGNRQGPRRPARRVRRADSEVVGLLAALTRRYRMAVVTNGSGRVQRAKLARLGLGAGTPRAFVSGELGVAKPDPAPFRAALAWAGCRPEEALFVGDDPGRDIAGASGVGMATCWVSAGRAYPAGFPRPGLTIRGVADLAREVPP